MAEGRGPDPDSYMVNSAPRNLVRRFRDGPLLHMLHKCCTQMLQSQKLALSGTPDSESLTFAICEVHLVRASGTWTPSVTAQWMQTPLANKLIHRWPTGRVWNLRKWPRTLAHILPTHSHIRIFCAHLGSSAEALSYCAHWVTWETGACVRHLPKTHRSNVEGYRGGPHRI